MNNGKINYKESNYIRIFILRELIYYTKISKELNLYLGHSFN